VDVWRGYIGKSEVDNIMIGSGFVVTLPQGFPKGKYIFTLDHIVSRDEFFVQTPPYGRRVNIVEKKISEKTYLRYNNKEVEIEELINDSSVDFALYKLPDDVSIPSFPYAFGRSNELQRGNVTYLLGRSGNLAEILLRRGIVANPIGWKFPIFFEEYEQYKNVINNMKKIHSWYSSDRVSQVTAGLNPGDSACPIVGLRDGVPELIAMAQATIPGREKMGLALKIDFILGLIKTFFELTPAHP